MGCQGQPTGMGGQEGMQGADWRSGLAVTAVRQEADALCNLGWRVFPRWRPSRDAQPWHAAGAAFSQCRRALLPRCQEHEEGEEEEVLYCQVKHLCKEVFNLGRTAPAQVKPGAGIKGLSLHEGQSQQWLSVHSSVPASARKRAADKRGCAGWGYVGIVWKYAVCDRRCTVSTFHEHSPHSIQNQGPF